MPPRCSWATTMWPCSWTSLCIPRTRRTAASARCSSIGWSTRIRQTPGRWPPAWTVCSSATQESRRSTSRCWNEEYLGDPALLAGHLNSVFLDAVRSELESGERDEQGILGDDGPTWFRPFPWSDLLPLAGVRQVVGHTPPVDELEAVDFHMVDPCAFYGMEDSKRFRYAVIEDGEVTVVEGSLDLSRPSGSSMELAEVCR